MSPRPTRRILFGLLAAFGLLAFMASPASADGTGTGEIVRSRITVSSFLGPLTFDTPSGSSSSCEGTREITVTTDDSAPSGSIDNVTMKTPFESPFSAGTWYQLELQSTSTPQATNWDGDSFSGEAVSFSFAIQSFNNSTCTKGSNVCVGTVTVVFSGEEISGDVPDAGSELRLNGTSNTTGGAAIDTGNPCSFPWTVIDGGHVNIGENPAYPSDDGAIVEF